MVITATLTFYQKHKRWAPIAFFILGFIFDATVLNRIDELEVIIQQALYIIISGTLISVELIEHTREVQPPRLLSKVWKYREEFLHFLMGTLLNCYTIFYFKSASAFTSFIFIAMLVILLVLNEFKRFGESQTKVHVAFLSLCLISYLITLSPIIFGFIGVFPFIIANCAAGGACYGYWRFMKKKLISKPDLLTSHIIKPFIYVQVLFLFLYFTRLIPPVPLSVTYMGVYHNVEKKDGEYELTYMRPRWKIWQNGDQTFLARPGDAVFCFVGVFSPSGFKDKLQVRWLYDDPKLGWQSADAIPLPILGGREEGYRGFTRKNNYQPGNWRVQIETLDSREVGRINFAIVADESTEPRTETKEFR